MLRKWRCTYCHWTAKSRNCNCFHSHSVHCDTVVQSRVADLMKVLNLVLAVLFLLFAFVQINDPDPVLWILVYGAMAVACVLAAFRYYYPIALVVLILLFAACAVTYIPGVLDWLQSDDRSLLFDDLAKMQYPYIEESREFLGLLICIAVLIMHWISYRRIRKAYS